MEWKIKKFNDLTNIELYEILRLRSEVFILEQNCNYQDLDRKDYDSYHLFQINENNEFTAYLRILPKGISYNEVSIGRVLTKPSNRKNKSGRMMIETAINFIEKQLGETEIRISAQKYLIKFYESFGFKITSDEYLEDNIPHVEMFYNK
ncbi:GNAT family N-acetyltransferase [Haploplasma axanthum]|uniref:Putative acyltransferase n=1 Tax=Haploplasma axanthum TaxID=29552 RepID=A0A449BB91_HAPAX|nr:GNAT family N-acetyltransferase [Haploplasma axanthum]VEU79583.1 putative acyltransferase [Haploplasma axanthum]